MRKRWCRRPETTRADFGSGSPHSSRRLPLYQRTGLELEKLRVPAPRDSGTSLHSSNKIFGVEHGILDFLVKAQSREHSRPAVRGLGGPGGPVLVVWVRLGWSQWSSWSGSLRRTALDGSMALNRGQKSTKKTPRESRKSEIGGGGEGNK